MNLRGLLVAALMAAVLSGCATKSGKPPLELSALPAPKEGQGIVFVMRSGALVGFGTPARIILDGKELGTLWNDTYLAFPILPGMHTINVKWFIRVDEVKLVAAQGGTYFIETGWKGAKGCSDPRAICVGTSAEVISKERGLSLLVDMKETSAP